MSIDCNYFLELNKIHLMNCIDGLQLLPPKSVHTCVSSPPYFNLRDYGLEPTSWPAITYSLFGFKIKVKAQTVCLGLEKTPQDYIGHLVHIYRLVRETLRDDGTVWVNIGDSYVSTAPGSTGDSLHIKGLKSQTANSRKNFRPKTPIGLKPKDLIGIPWMLSFALRADGWYLRQDIIWHKTFSMPESVTDRCTKNHEYIFLLSKSKKYYYDFEAIKTPLKDSSVQRLSQDIDSQLGSDRVPFKTNGTMKATVKGYQKLSDHKKITGHSGNYKNGELIGNGLANKRSVWTVNPASFKEAHFAVFPQELITDCIKAGSPEGGTVLDMFMGSGTTAIVAVKLNRAFIGFEQNPKYLKIAEKRMRNELGFFNPNDLEMRKEQKTL